jgi:hypothetical protein
MIVNFMVIPSLVIYLRLLVPPDRLLLPLLRELLEEFPEELEEDLDGV